MANPRWSNRGRWNYQSKIPLGFIFSPFSLPFYLPFVFAASLHKLIQHISKVQIRESGKGHLKFTNLNKHVVTNEEEALNLLFLGDTNRMICETPMNKASSRSHCVFTVCIQEKQEWKREWKNKRENKEKPKEKWKKNESNSERNSEKKVKGKVKEGLIKVKVTTPSNCTS